MRIDYEPITYNDDSHDGTGDNHAAESQNLMWSSFAFAQVRHCAPYPVQPSPTQPSPAQNAPFVLWKVYYK
ncbi:predicted protein [Botrytis cinerea T4]|uniref:Uncharacterized protein n=1 Tax=Botryotinia fuckeliana (strain T4) TaxID=999810 RepID=G2XPL4_BOTF4|nr:predicted protein [Botrytis cinerea T4]